MIQRRSHCLHVSRLSHKAAALALVGCLLAAAGAASSASSSAAALQQGQPGGYPRPSIAPVAWEIDLKYRHPRRIVVQAPGEPSARAYWYMVYTVTNNSDREIFFLPEIEMLTRDGRVLPANRGIPGAVFDAIQQRTRSMELTLPQDMTASLLVGEDEQRHSVAIWEEPHVEMGQFDIYFEGLSGEVVVLTDVKGNPLKDPEGNPIRVRKTRQLRYTVRGDEIRPEIDQAVQLEDTWVMR